MCKIEQSSKVNVISDENGKNIVLINDIRFKTRRTIKWDEVEEYLKEYIGKYYEILETSEKIYIGTDFPDEFCHSQDKIKLKGGNEKAKANMVTAIGELIRVATNKAISEDFGKNIRQRHSKDGIDMIHVLEFQYIIQKGYCNNIIFTLQDC